MKTLKPGPKPRLSPDDRAAIRRSKLTIPELMKQYQVSQNVIYEALRTRI